MTNIQDLIAARQAAITELEQQRQAVFEQLDLLAQESLARYDELETNLDEIDANLDALNAGGERTPLPTLANVLAVSLGEGEAQ